MRILVLSNLYPPVVRGGYEIECRDVVDHLRRRHEVTVLASRLGARQAPPVPGVLRTLPWTGGLRRRDALAAPLTTRRAIAITRRTLARVRPDAIYVWNGAGVPAAVLRTLQTSQIPVLVRVCEYWFATVYTHDQFLRYVDAGIKRPGLVHGAERGWSMVARGINALPGWRLETRQPLPAAVCWNSRWVRAGAPAPTGIEVVHRAVIIPSNARTEHMATIPRRPRPGRVLYVGRLDERKGAASIVRALGLLVREHGVAADLVLVGDGDAAERSALTRLAVAEGVGDRVRLAGALRGAPFDDEVAAAAAWCVPSIWDEPAPLTCTEAALARVPAVFSRVGGIPEMFTDDVHALFHAPDDAAGAARALKVALAGGPEVDERVARARARGHELSFRPYLAGMDAFLEDGMTALGTHGVRPAAA